MTKPLTYLDLELELSSFQPDGTFKVRVLYSPVGGMAANQAETSRYEPDSVPENSEIDKSLSDMVRRWSSRNARRPEMMELGARLANMLLVGRVREIYGQALAHVQPINQGLRFRLRIEPAELANLPWELLYVQTSPGERNPNDFLALKREISITRYETTGKADRVIDPEEKIQLAIALASPAGLEDLDLEKEERAILSAAAAVNRNGPVLEVSTLGSLINDTPPATRDELPNLIVGAHIFHFAGHGLFEEGESGQILLEDEDGDPDGFSAEQLANLLGNAGVGLAVLGACDGGKRDGVDHWTGVAPALVRERLPAVVSMQETVRDRNATLFDTILYTRLLGGYTIDEAVFEGRQAIFTIDRSKRERDWAVPVLYLRDDDGILFPLPEEPAASDQDVLRVRQEISLIEDSTVIGIEAQKILGGNLDVAQIFGAIKSGVVIGAKVDTLESGNIDVDQKAKEVGSGSKMVGAQIGTIGSLEHLTVNMPGAKEQTVAHEPLDPVLGEIAHKLNQYFSRSELDSLAFDLGIDYQNISGETKQERARELVLYCQRNELLDNLLTEARRQRPHVDW